MNSLTDLREVVDVVIGVDTHVHTHSAAVVDAATGGVLDEITVEATAEGYAELTSPGEQRGNVSDSSATGSHPTHRLFGSATSPESLHRAANALNCDLVYALVPRQPLEETVDARAKDVARRELAELCHTMNLEAQGLAAGQMQERLEELAEVLKARPGLWRD
jgi:hypothetical protein